MNQADFISAKIGMALAKEGVSLQCVDSITYLVGELGKVIYRTGYEDGESAELGRKYDPKEAKGEAQSL